MNNMLYGRPVVQREEEEEAGGRHQPGLDRHTHEIPSQSHN